MVLQILGEPAKDALVWSYSPVLVEHRVKHLLEGDQLLGVVVVDGVEVEVGVGADHLVVDGTELDGRVEHARGICCVEEGGDGVFLKGDEGQFIELNVIRIADVRRHANLRRRRAANCRRSPQCA